MKDNNSAENAHFENGPADMVGETQVIKSTANGELPEAGERTEQAGPSWPADRYDDPNVGRDPCERFDSSVGKETDDLPGSSSPAERADLEAIMPPAKVEAMEAARRGPATEKNNPRLIAENADQMVAEATNKRLHSGRGVGTWLIDHGLHEPVRGFNGFGDALGGHGLKLPHVTINGRRYYDLLCVRMTEEEKQQRQAELDSYEIDVLRAMIAA